MVVGAINDTLLDVQKIMIYLQRIHLWLTRPFHQHQIREVFRVLVQAQVVEERGEKMAISI
jgi:hypothetical protein